MSPVHLVVGATGVAGQGILRHIAGAGTSPVWALSRGGSVPPDLSGQVRGIAADLLDPESVANAVREAAPTHVYYAAQHHSGGAGDVHPRRAQAALHLGRPWMRGLGRLPGAQRWLYGPLNRRAGLVDGGQNRAMFTNLLAALTHAPVAHVALLTGGRLHGVHLGPHLWAEYQAILREEGPRHPGSSWYIDVEEALLGAASAWTRSIHRPHFVLGAVAGAPNSLINALGGYAALCREAGRPLVFLGGPAVFERRSEAVDAELIGAQMRWAASTGGAGGPDFLVTNGSPWRWTEIWPALALRYGLTWEVPKRALSITEVIANPDVVWARARERASLAQMPLGRAMSVAFLHQVMVITWDVEYSVDRSRAAGFNETRDPIETLERYLDRLEADGTLPRARAA